MEICRLKMSSGTFNTLNQSIQPYLPNQKRKQERTRMKTKQILGIFAALVALLCATSVQAAAGSPFTATTSGNWNSGVTWGNGGSTLGTDYPGNATDVSTIGGAIQVTYGTAQTSVGNVTISSTASPGLLSHANNPSFTSLTINTGSSLDDGGFGESSTVVGNLTVNGSMTGQGSGPVLTFTGTGTVSGSGTISYPVMTFATGCNQTLARNLALNGN